MVQTIYKGPQIFKQISFAELNQNPYKMNSRRTG